MTGTSNHIVDYKSCNANISIFFPILSIHGKLALIPELYPGGFIVILLIAFLMVAIFSAWF